MSDKARTTLYNPLSRSQVAFIPIDFYSIENSSDEISSDRVSIEKEYFDTLSLTQSITTHNHSLQTYSASSQEDADRLTLLSSKDSLGSQAVDRIRYKIMLNLSPREIQLIRSSWDMIINDGGTNEHMLMLFRKIDQDGFGSASILHGVGASNSVMAQRRNTVSTSITTNISGSSVSSFHTVQRNNESANSNTFASSLFCAQFYGNMLEMDPGLELIYPSIKHQAIAYAGVLTTTINHLENLSVMDTYLSDLGKRHARILGIEPPHFELMGAAFLKTIQDRVGIYCTIELIETWSRLYSFLANSILQFGIDPVLEVNWNNEQITFPVPNIVEDTSTTIAPLWEEPDSDQCVQQSPIVANDDLNGTNIQPGQAQQHKYRSILSKKMDSKAISHKEQQPRTRSKNFDKRRGKGDKDCILM